MTPSYVDGERLAFSAEGPMFHKRRDQRAQLMIHYRITSAVCCEETFAFIAAGLKRERRAVVEVMLTLMDT